MDYIRWFDEIHAGEVDLVGGKGANLGELTRAGFPVPPGFCVTAQAYRDFLVASRLGDALQQTLAETDMQDADQISSSAERIRTWIREQPVPTDMAREVREGYRRLAESMGAERSAPIPVAVRSSATAEDLPEASFAGQQDTYLNIRGEDELLECVRRCWASLWTDRAVNYREKQNFDHSTVYLSVVVQAMVEAESAGVLFTANTLTGCRDEALINASWGLGESVVSGMVSPDTLTVRKHDCEVLSHILGAKEITIVYDPDGGTVELETHPEQRRQPVLTDEWAGELVNLGRRIETHYGKPQDIEWAIVGDSLYLLQARPITTLKPEREPVGLDGDYFRTMFIDIFPHPLSPLFLSVVEPLFKGMLDFSFETLGFKPPRDIPAIGVFYNQVYLNRDYIAATLQPLSPAVRDPLIESFVNPFGHQKEKAATEQSLSFLRMVVSILRFMVRFPKQLPGLLARYHQEVREIAAFPMEEASDSDLVSYVKRLVFDSSSRLLNYDYLMLAVIKRNYGFLGSLLKRFYGEDTDEVVSRLISGVTGNVVMESNKALWDLSRVAQKSQAVSTLLRAHPPDQVLEHLEKDPQAQGFLEALDGFLQEYGHREVLLDIYYPTWIEDPTPVLSFVRGYLDADEKQSPHSQQDRLVRERLELTEEVFSHVTQMGVVRYLVSPILRWVLDQSQVHTRERDTMHFEMTRLFPPARRFFLELGRRWTERGLVDEQADIFFLSLDELEAMAADPCPAQDKAATLKAEFEENQTHPWPDAILRGEEVYLQAPAQEGEPGDALQGVAGSPGTVTSTARVITGPHEFDRLEKGEILVAPLTNPAWTPLFAIAGGIVTEVGGILSHGAIVAREYGIPAVMSVAGITRQVLDGQRITVNGNQGTVSLGS